MPSREALGSLTNPLSAERQESAACPLPLGNTSSLKKVCHAHDQVTSSEIRAEVGNLIKRKAAGALGSLPNAPQQRLVHEWLAERCAGTVLVFRGSRSSWQKKGWLTSLLGRGGWGSSPSSEPKLEARRHARADHATKQAHADEPPIIPQLHVNKRLTSLCESLWAGSLRGDTFR